MVFRLSANVAALSLSAFFSLSVLGEDNKAIDIHPEVSKRGLRYCISLIGREDIAFFVTRYGSFDLFDADGHYSYPRDPSSLAKLLGYSAKGKHEDDLARRMQKEEHTLFQDPANPTKVVVFSDEIVVMAEYEGDFIFVSFVPERNFGFMYLEIPQIGGGYKSYSLRISVPETTSSHDLCDLAPTS